MAGGSPAPTDTTDTTSHINTEYDSDEDGVVEKARDADTLDSTQPGNLSVSHADTAGDANTVDGQHASDLSTPNSTQAQSATASWVPYGDTPKGVNLYGPTDTVEVKKSNNLSTQDISHTIRAADGTTWSNTHTIGENETNYYTIDTQGKYIVEMSTGGTDSYSSANVRFRPVALANHSHSI